MISYFRLVAVLFVALVTIATRPAFAGDTLAAAKAAGSLSWGADQEGGAPYIFPSETDQETLIGFEVELADALTKQMGLKITFQQSQWDALPSMLQARKVDFIMNGYEFMTDRAEAMETSIPSLRVRASTRSPAGRPDPELGAAEVAQARRGEVEIRRSRWIGGRGVPGRVRRRDRGGLL